MEVIKNAKKKKKAKEQKEKTPKITTPVNHILYYKIIQVFPSIKLFISFSLYDSIILLNLYILRSTVMFFVN